MTTLLEELDKHPKIIVRTKNLRFVAYPVLDKAGKPKPAMFEILSQPWQVGYQLLNEEKFICQNWRGRSTLISIDHTEEPVL